MKVEEQGGLRALARISAEWDELVSRSIEPVPFLRASFLRAWWRGFGRGRPRLVIVRDTGGGLVGGALFAHRWGTVRGIPVRELALASNVHSNRADLVAEAGYEKEVGIALARWACRSRTGWNVLRIDGVPEESAVLRAFSGELERLGFPRGAKPAERPPWIPIENGLAAFEATLASKWKSNLRNREKRIAAIGELTHETITSATPDLDARLDECFALEAKTWKGAQGSAIDSDPRTRRFYRQIAKDAAADGTLRLHTFRVGGRLAAFQLDVEAAAIEYVIKIGYEPELSKLSPGALLLKRVIAAAISRGLERVDLLGGDMPWKRDWTGRVRPHVSFFAFGRGPLGISLHALEFVAVPLAKAALKKRAPRRPDASVSADSDPAPLPVSASAPAQEVHA